jgi:hypothetical protein
MLYDQQKKGEKIMKKKSFMLVSLLIIIFIAFFSASSCASSDSSTKQTKEIPFVQVGAISDVLNANFTDLTDLFGANEAIGDNEIPKIPEIDIISVSAADDKDNIRFDIYHSAPISLKDDIFFGFVQYWSDGYDIYMYFPLTNELYLTLYDKNSKPIKSVNLDLEKAKVTLIPWSLAEKNPVNVASIILNKSLHWGIKPGSPASLIVRFVAGVYIKDKGIYYSDMTPTIKIEFNY